MDFLRKAWDAWRAFGRFMGNAVARVVLSLFYFTIFVPFALGAQLFTDPLGLQARHDTFWLARHTKDQTVADATRQF